MKPSERIVEIAADLMKEAEQIYCPAALQQHGWAIRNRCLIQALIQFEDEKAGHLPGPTGETPMPKRQSSSKSSTLAGKTLRDPRASKRTKSLAGSVLAQDETKGQAPKKRKAKGRR